MTEDLTRASPTTRFPLSLGETNHARHARESRPAGEDRRSLAVPKGPRGERRPADAVGCAVHVARIAVGEIEDEKGPPKQPAKVRSGRARAEALSPERRREIARQAAATRWEGGSGLVPLTDRRYTGEVDKR